MDISTIYTEYNMEEMESKISALFPDWDLHFFQLFSSIIEGKGLQSIKEISYKLLDLLANELGSLKSIFITIILLGIISAVFINLTDIFGNHQIADCGFYLTYLIMIIFLIKIFGEVFLLTKETMENIVSFLKIFLPTYFLTVTAAGGSVTAIGFYQVFMFVVYSIEALLVGMILPITGCYSILGIVNGIWEEEKLSLMLQLIKRGITGMLKVLITIVSGTGIIQSMITPVIDSVKMNAVQKSISIIPGLGDLAGSAAQVLLGSAVLIKNATGLLLLVLLILICAIPLLKLFGIMALLKGAAAIMGIAADKRMTNCTNRIGDGVMMLFQTTLCSITFFVILISIIAFTTNRGI